MAIAYFDNYPHKTLEIKLPKVITPCFCDRDITEDELKDIVIQLRKKDDIKQVKQNVLDLKKTGHTIDSSYNGNEKKTWVYKNEDGIFLAKWGNDGYYTIDTKEFVQKNKPEEYTLKKSVFDDLGSTLFNSSKDEKIQSSDANYKTFAEHLNCTFSTYNIDTCIRKIHFLAQSYHETERFVDTYEDIYSETKPFGGKSFVGRGIKQLTHDENYLAYYDYKKNKNYLEKCKTKDKTEVTKTITEKPEKFPKEFLNTLKKFSKTLAKDLQIACDSAGFFWEFKSVHKFADADNVTELTRRINGGKKGLEKRKTYTKYLKEIFDYENCIDKK